VGKPEGKRPLGRRMKNEDNIKMHLKETEQEDVQWINVAQDRDMWRTVMKAAMNLRVP
jgi:hypothetical protein